jgi:hypothetical protein
MYLLSSISSLACCRWRRLNQHTHEHTKMASPQKTLPFSCTWKLKLAAAAKLRLRPGTAGGNRCKYLLLVILGSSPCGG